MPCENSTSCQTINLTSLAWITTDLINTTLTHNITTTLIPNITTTTTLTSNISNTTINTTTLTSKISNTTIDNTTLTFDASVTPNTSFTSASILDTAVLTVNSTSTPTTAAVLREDPVRLGHGEVVVTMCLSICTILTNLLVLFLTKFAGGGQSPTMVFVRMLCMSDFFLGCYGLGKMLMFLYVDHHLMINFFLPESLFFTASTASSLSLLLLNMDRCVKIAWPLWYTQNMDKPSIITGMVFLWNVSFVLGFLPLLGWNSQRQVFVFDLFHFFPWHYLLVMGLVWVLCIAGTVGILLWVRQRFDLTLQDHGHLSYHLTEVEKYCKLRVTIAVDVITWTLCYLPFLVFVGLACDGCPLGGRPEFKVDVYHFVPVFMLRSLAGAGIQLYRTVRVQGLVKLQHGAGSINTPSHRHHHHHGHRRFLHKRSSEENGVSAISYANPLCENSVTEFSSLDDTFPTLPLGAYATRGGTGQEGQEGISNPAYRPSIPLDLGQGIYGVTEEITAL